MDDRKLTEAVKELRLALNDTQQSFAYRMKTAIRTIARWETIRPPSGGTLIKLAKEASTQGRVDLAEVFMRAISDEIGYFVPRFEILPHERPDFDALVAILRSAGYKNEREEWQRISGTIKTRHVHSDATAAANAEMIHELRRRIAAGEPDDEVIRGLGPEYSDVVEALRKLDKSTAASRKGGK